MVKETSSMRSLRRHQLERAKAKAAKQWLRWHNPERTQPGRRALVYTAQDLKRQVGKLAAQHCTHICFMCHREKLLSHPKVSDVRRTLWESDFELELQ